VLVWRAGRRFGVDGDVPSRRNARSVAALAAIAVAAAVASEWAVLDPLSLFTRGLGVVLFAVLAVVAAHVIGANGGPLPGWSFTAAAVAVLVHSQIEMTFFQSSSVVWAMVALGLVGVAGADGAVTTRRPARLIGGTLGMGLLLVAAVWIVVCGALPATIQEHRMGAAAAALRPLREAQASGRAETSGLEAACREEAADHLLRAYEALPITSRPLEAAAGQLRLAARASDSSQARGELLRAREIVHDAIEFHGDPSAISLAIVIERRLADMTGEERFLRSAAALARSLTVIDPQGLGSWVRLGDLAWDVGDHREARRAYRRALENDANFELDPLKRLPESERLRLQERLRQGTHQP
jgi:hypothetical protein